jgi:hypothetical protein
MSVSFAMLQSALRINRVASGSGDVDSTVLDLDAVYRAEIQCSHG